MQSSAQTGARAVSYTHLDVYKRQGRTRMKQLRLSSLDAAAAVVMAAMFGLILALNTLFPPVL